MLTLDLRPDTARYTDLTDHQQTQIDHILDLLDTEYGVQDIYQRRLVSVLGAQILGIDLPAGADLARCRGTDANCPVLTASVSLHRTADGYRCTDCMPGFISQFGE
ncbi:hypothetical protein [Kitasatospora sp. NPDC087315]|uniref:hypothetical protein n=1 Tax=Kitasatospora sp. NPDC087315 TaxID=3364069 RepID=UPI003814547F